LWRLRSFAVIHLRQDSPWAGRIVPGNRSDHNSPGGLSN
jgi:hypothetical protein